ncbi:MAG TPA: hypothetical protein VGO87_02705 [Acidimicrobiia bacterium]
MSKRSYRRLAVVTGAALAVGTMAPALAAHVTADGSSAVSVDSIGVTDVTNALPAVGLPLGTVSTLAGSLVTTATAVPTLALYDVSNIAGDAVGLGGGLLSGGLTAGLTGAAAASLGGVAVSAAGIVNAPFDVLGTVSSSGLVDDTLGAAHGVGGLAVPVALGAVSTVTSTAFGAVGTVTSLPGAATGILSAVMGTSASANVGLLAGVGGIL